MTYREEIDGLRAVAVLPVILYHAGIKSFQGGFVGVDIFFVISGYLITSILLSDLEQQKFSIVNFYERRARRILPALFLVLLCSLPFAYFWLLPHHMKDFGQSLSAICVFSSNILFWQESDYFGAASQLKPMLHTWSLAVEEQYYLLFPLFLMVLWRLKKRWLFIALLIIAVSSLVFSQWGAHNIPAATFFLLPSRAWELAIGALAAFFLFYKREQVASLLAHRLATNLISLFGLFCILFSVFTFDHSTPFPSFYALVPTLGTALIILFAGPDTLVGRFLSIRIMVTIGLISYSAYLWHQPMFVFARHRSVAEPGLVLRLILASAALILAYLSWRWVEAPFRNKQLISRKKVFSFAVTGSFVFALIGLAGHVTNGFAGRVTDGGERLADLDKKVEYNHGLHSDCIDFTLSPHCRTSDKPEILVWGDSFAMHTVNGIMSSNPNAEIIQMTKGVCGPFFDVAPVNKSFPVSWGCIEFSNKVRQWLKENKTVKYAVLSSPFIHYLGYEKTYSLYLDNKMIKPNVQLAKQMFLKTLDELRGMGVTPVVISPPPRNSKNIGECLVKNEFFGGDLNSCDFARTGEAEFSVGAYDFLRSVEDSVKVIYLDQAICHEGKCQAAIDGHFIYMDYGHLSVEGSAYIGRQLGFYDLIVRNDRMNSITDNDRYSNHSSLP